MGRRIKLALISLLGFSTACSTVRESGGSKDVPSDSPAPAVRQPEIRLMYGVRPPAVASHVELPDESPAVDETAE